jgi:cation diffusion facilitator CzcD-associated flavoprotein CzcO
MLKGEVQSLNWSPIHVKGLDHAMGFCVQTSDGARIGAKAIVCAVGMGGCPSVPAPLLASGAISATHNSGWAHSSCLADPSYSFPPRDCNKGTLFVIGGGLTSAQICDLAIHRGFAKVILVLRGHLKGAKYPRLDNAQPVANLKQV